VISTRRSEEGSAASSFATQEDLTVATPEPAKCLVHELALRVGRADVR